MKLALLNPPTPRERLHNLRRLQTTMGVWHANSTGWSQNVDRKATLQHTWHSLFPKSYSKSSYETSPKKHHPHYPCQLSGVDCSSTFRCWGQSKTSLPPLFLTFIGRLAFESWPFPAVKWWRCFTGRCSHPVSPKNSATPPVSTQGKRHLSLYQVTEIAGG